ncbi:MAG: hypothetical protein RMJ66_02940 [Bacteroidia bacterium]|nr:hypothetical protein [Bacteroidia bacterium]MDW8134002.1 hypothetical protein [Bacteroidia bacterium]
MIRYSFQPGPSQLAEPVPELIQEALKKGILSRYHRDSFWRETYAQAQEALYRYLKTPPGWLALFTSSATETWQILADATAGKNTLHITQGPFGERWHTLQSYTTPHSHRYELSLTETWEAQLRFLQTKYGKADLIGIVHVETSIGATLPAIEQLRAYFPEAIIAVDATSSLGGLLLPWEDLDIVFASVQKCLGLPAGMAILLLSPRSIEIFKVFKRSRYNTLSYLIDQASKHEPPYTPNLLNIFLLAKLLERTTPLTEIELHLKRRASILYQELEGAGYVPLVPPPYRADTVLGFRWQDPRVGTLLRAKAEQEGLYIGWGYGENRQTHFRIANFPTLPDEAYTMVMQILKA